MKRLFRFLSITTLVAMLASCGVFFAPIEGRWNIKDPSNELLTFKPSADGYVEGTVWHDGVIDLYAWPDSKIILMRFDTAEFPESVAASYLKLQVYMAPQNDADLSIHRIISDWDTATIMYSIANDPGRFYDDSAEAQFTISKSVKIGDDIQIPLTEVYNGGKDKLTNGLVILSSKELKFYSTESGKGPVLSIEPE